MLSIIVAFADNNVIGKDNKLIWRLPEDLKRFKNITTGKKIIMGRKTFESLGRVLPNRFHIVLTKNKDYKIDNENVKIIHDVEELKPYIESVEECFVIGGEKIYKMLMPYATKLYVTRLYEKFDGDTFFPEIDERKWKIVYQEKGIKNENNPYNYEFIDYVKNI
jgi:dihydrofolate reductase